MTIEQIIIIILAIIGFAVSFYIHYHKSSDTHLSCVIGKNDCNKVVNGKYSKFIGVNNEVLGMLYYGFMAFVYLSAFSFPIFQIWHNTLIITAITGVAALFSVFLTLIQIFKLKEFCEWCLISAGISILIFILFVL